MSKPSNLRELYLFALSLYGLPYNWGCVGPMAFDGPGFAKYVLMQVMTLPEACVSSQDLSMFLLQKGGKRDVSGLGALAFFGSGTVSHVGFCIDPLLMIHAGGGGPQIQTIAQAECADAKVRIEPTHYLPDFSHFVMPAYRF